MDIFTTFVKSNIPFAGDGTVKKLVDAGVNSIDRLNEATYDELRAAGLRRPVINGILLYIAKHKQLFRFNKNFDSYYDPSDLFYIVPITAITFLVLLLSVFGYEVVSGAILIGVCFVQILICGLYWVYILVQRKAAASFIHLNAFTIFTLLISGLVSQIFNLEFHFPLPLFQTSFVLWLITFGHFKIIKYKNPLNIRIKSIEFFAQGICGLSLIYLMLHGAALFTHRQIFASLDYLDAITIILFFAFLAGTLHLGYSISERKRIRERTMLIRMFLLVFLFFAIFVSKSARDAQVISFLSFHAFSVLNVIFPVIFLYAYILFPTNFFPRLSMVFLIFLLALTIAPLLSYANVLGQSSDHLWTLIGSIADLIQIFSFLFFSGAVLHLFTRKAAKSEDEDIEHLVITAAAEELSWSDNCEPFSQYESYWNASNLCFQYGFFEHGVDLLTTGLEKRRWRYYDESILHYQIACGYSLMNEGDSAITSLKRALKLYPHLNKFVAEDEMLDNIRGDILAMNG